MGGSVVMDPQAAEPVKRTVEALGELLALGTDSEATVAQMWLTTLHCPRCRSWQHSEAWASRWLVQWGVTPAQSCLLSHRPFCCTVPGVRLLSGTAVG